MDGKISLPIMKQKIYINPFSRPSFRKIEKQKNRKTEKQKNRKIEKQKNRKTEKQKNKKTEKIYFLIIVFTPNNISNADYISIILPFKQNYHI